MEDISLCSLKKCVVVSRFRCLKGWKQFGGSCYYPSIMKSRPDEANRTCSLLHVNNTHLMRIRHSVELSYAAHLFFTNNLTTLLLETDPQLFKSKMFMDMVSAADRTEWQIIEDKLYQARLEFKLKTESSNASNENEKNQIYSSDEDDDAFERFKNIHNLCDQFAWNVLNNNSHIFTFTTYKIWGKLVCSLSDIDFNSTYEHVCEYVLDFCFGNIMCGKHGRCVNSIETFKCSCSFFFGGVLCDKFAHQILQMIIAVIIIIILWLLLLITKICSGLRSIHKWIGECCKKTEATPTVPKHRETWKEKFKKKSFIRSIWLGVLFFIFFCFLLVIPVIVQVYSFPFLDVDPFKSQSLIDEALSMLKKCERKSFFSLADRIFLGISIILTIIFLLLAIRIRQKPIEFQLKKNGSAKVNRRRGSNRYPPSNREPQAPENISLLPRPTLSARTYLPNVTNRPSNEITHPSDDTVESSENTEDLPDNPIQSPEDMTPPVDDTNHLPDDTSQSSNDNNYSSNLPPLSPSTIPSNPKKSSLVFVALIDPFQRINRYETAAIFGILTFEILKVFDEILLAKSEVSGDGVLIMFLKRMVVIVLIGCRYYPILISLRLRHVIVQLLTFCHMLAIITYTIYRESFCLDFLPHSENLSARDQVQLRFQLSTGFIIYGIFANLPHFALLSYSNAEFGTRLLFDLYHKYPETENKETEDLQKSPQETSSSDFNPSRDRSTLQKYLDKIYIWDKDFLFSSIVISTYTVNFIILYHLACTFSFLNTTRMMSPISFMTNTLEQMFNIEIKDRLFHTEIILSAIITALIYGIQLFFGMKNFREHIKRYRDKDPIIIAQIEAKIDKEKTRSRAIQYPGYLIRYTIGGFLITFHLLIFITLIPRIIWRHSYSFKYVLEFILPILILYALQSLIARWSSTLIDIQNQRPPQVNNNNTSELTPNTGVRHSPWKANFKNNLKNNFRNILQYFILVANCFIGIASSILRFIMGILFNIAYMNRIDFCLYRDPLEKFDRANMAFWHFLHEEVYSTLCERPDIQEINLTGPSSEDAASNDDPSLVSSPKELCSGDTSRINDFILQDGMNHVLKEKQLFLLQNWDKIIKRNRQTKVSGSFTISQQLAAIGCKKIKILGDGNCFFRAISHQLYNSENEHSYVRSQAVNHIQLNMNFFAPFINESRDPTIGSYIERMDQEGIYADHLAISATAAVINKNIIVHEIGKTPLLIPGSTSPDDQLHVWYDPKKEHYESVVCRDGSLPRLSSEQILET